MEKLSTRTGLSGTALKRIACVSMLIDHIGASCILAGYYSAALLAGGTIFMDPQLLLIYRILRWVGRIAFPIYCFLLTEGFVHTSDVRRYAGRLLALALISEFPFDWAFFRSAVHWGHQNVYWTLLFGVFAMACVCWGTSDGSGWPRRLAGVLGAVACAAAAELLNTDYGASGVALIALLYALRSSRLRQCAAGAVLVWYELPAPLAFVPVWFYSGQRGRCGPAQKWAFYFFYPFHLLLLGCITNLLIGR